MRLVALLILVAPGVLAVYGIKLIRDSLFGELQPIFLHLFLQGVAGVIFVIGGLFFIGGFILHRDRKRNKTKGRFENR
ncbi:MULTISPECIES: DUF2627 domain-containing protein [Salimicrobium]|uniref:DUF2627 domain-containing protein n=3 Tax=Salimicrobium TaxID=351195 RepID=K2FIS5_9BACI|nr:MULTISPECIES: DUF2627 domain-containing protein [Salimicrobium]AKG04344.1 hypothetical protein AAV35_005790 [Salimicrobium jeotgali]EKE31011.1 hypothetical protein MJ3_10466 [Salimicrobium jeotgali]MBM7697449.1 hypothetical protein [Salimicrobium jeotgali]SDX70008.1 Protein of unknown function [Salimicrobium album]SIS54256.1 Protein of unknown function [Salimicrobium salexigens]